MNKELETKIERYLSVAKLLEEIQHEICNERLCSKCPLYRGDGEDLCIKFAYLTSKIYEYRNEHG